MLAISLTDGIKGVLDGELMQWGPKKAACLQKESGYVKK